MEILTALLGILGIIILGIVVIALRKRALISDTLNATMELKKAQKEMEKQLYQKEMVKQMPDMIKAKVAKDIEKKLNKKSLSEKLALASKELTNNAKGKGMEHKGLDSILSDLNVFGKNENQYKNADFVRGRKKRPRNGHKEPFDLNDLTKDDLIDMKNESEYWVGKDGY